jgi:hypothetical protein
MAKKTNKDDSGQAGMTVLKENNRACLIIWVYEAVIPRLDRGIQCFQGVLDCPVKPDDDNR